MRLVNADHAPVYLNEEACEQIKNMPTVDAVPVVRCKNCKNAKISIDNIVQCAHPSGKRIMMMPYNFCSYGERKEGAKNG